MQANTRQEELPKGLSTYTAPVAADPIPESGPLSLVNAKLMPANFAAQQFIYDLRQLGTGTGAEQGLADEVSLLRGTFRPYFGQDGKTFEEFAGLLGKTTFTPAEEERLRLTFLSKIYNEAVLHDRADWASRKGGAMESWEATNERMRVLCNGWKVPYAEKPVDYLFHNGPTGISMYNCGSGKDAVVILGITGNDEYDKSKLTFTGDHETVHIYLQPLVDQFALSDPEKETLVDYVLAKLSGQEPASAFNYANKELAAFKQVLCSRTGDLDKFDLQQIVAEYKKAVSPGISDEPGQLE